MPDAPAPATRRLLRTFRWDALSAEQAKVLRVLLGHQGAKNAILVPAAAEAAGLPTRAAQYAVKSLIEDHGVPIAASSGDPAGWYLCVDDKERARERAGLRSRALSILRRARAFDPDTDTRLAEMFGEQLPLGLGGRHA